MAQSEPSSTLSRPPPAAWLLLVLALVLVTGLAREVGIGFLLPQQSEPDGVVYDAQVRILGAGRAGQKGSHLLGLYPHLVPRIALAVAPDQHLETAPGTLQEHLERARSPRRSIREVVAWLSLALIPAAWLLARRFLSEPWSFAAAGLCATSVLTTWFAQQARPHAVLAAFSALGVACAVQLARQGRWRDWIASALAFGLAIATLQSGLALLPPLALAAFVRVRRDGKRAWLGCALVLATAALFVRLFYPFYFEDYGTNPGKLSAEGSVLDLSGHKVLLAYFNGRGFEVVARALWEYEPLEAALAAAGLVLALRAGWCTRREWLIRARAEAPSNAAPRLDSSLDPSLDPSLDAGARDALEPGARFSSARRLDLAIVLAYVVPYLIAIGLYQRTYQRFALPLVPFLALLAAFALQWMFQGGSATPRYGARAWLGRTAAIVLLAAQVAACARLLAVRARPDTITEAAAWVAQHTQPGVTRVSVMPSIDLPLLQTKDARDKNERANLDVAYPWYSYQWRLPPEAYFETGHQLESMLLFDEARRAAARGDSDAFVRALRAEIVVLEVFSNGRRQVLDLVRQTVQRSGRLLVRISPDHETQGGEVEDLPLLYQDDEFPTSCAWAWRAVRARCVGPVLEIYDLR